MLDSASQKVAIFKAWLRRNSGSISSKHNAEDGNFLTGPTSRLMKGDNQGTRHCVVSLAKGVTIACERRLVPSALVIAESSILKSFGYILKHIDTVLLDMEKHDGIL